MSPTISIESNKRVCRYRAVITLSILNDVDARLVARGLVSLRSHKLKYREY